MGECKTSFITTPIYYVNDVPHIGHAYTTVIADTMARFARLIGKDTYFLTGTDEHGQKIEQAARARGKEPKEYADEISSKFKELWDEFEISYDDFIRTTEDRHKIGVQKAFEVMSQKGDIYKDVYEGNYCVSCETFFSDRELIDDENCPDCGKQTNLVKEESYFFKLSKYENKLLKWYEENEYSVIPKGKKNEVISFVKQGLNDLSITRTSFDWGVKLPEKFNDPKHVVYVWLDALMNYVTALGYGSKDESKMRYWPARAHIVGKDILRFHAIYWPAFLMSLNLPLPKHVCAHGWWTRNGEKMSKSKGNVVNPKEVADAYGLENFRYFMLREVPFGQDGDFSQKALIDRINSDLGNDLGNLLNRVIGMSGKYFDFNIDSRDVKSIYQKELKSVEEVIESLPPFFYQLQTNRYLEELWKVLTLANQSIAIYEPWVMMKNDKKDEAMALIALIANILAKTSIMLYPVMPKTSQKIADALGFVINNEAYVKYIQSKELLGEFKIKKIPPLFPKIEKELMKSSQPAKPSDTKDDDGLISIDRFFESKIVVGVIKSVDDVEGSSKLYELKVDLGEGRDRQIIAGIKKYYSKEELENRQVCVVANLKPAKIMGKLSEGMILAAKSGKKLTLIKPEKEIKNGAEIG